MPFSASLLSLLACREPAPPDDESTTPIETAHTGRTPTETGRTPTDTATTGVTADTGPTAVEVDCAAVPPSPVSVSPVAEARAYHDVIFDTAGNLIGNDRGNLEIADSSGNARILAVGVGTVEGLGRLLDGDFVGSAYGTDTLFRFDSAGLVTPLVGDSGAYGVIVGHDGMIYTANNEAIERIDPATGDRTELYRDRDLAPKVIHWSVDHTKLYFGRRSSHGEVFVLETDPVTLDVIGEPTLFASVASSGYTTLDCLTVDICGNVYLCAYDAQKMYRIDPNGVVSVYFDFSSEEYAHGAEWGSGVGGFRVDALYVAQPYNGNTVAEVVVGIPGRDWDGTGWTPSP